MADSSKATTLLALIEAQARKHASSPALLAPDRPPLDYAALLGEVERFGASLASMGLGRGHRVALALPNGPEMALAVCATMSWTTCAPLNPANDETVCRSLLTKMRAAALIVAAGASLPAVSAARALRIPVVSLAFERSDPAGKVRLSNDAPRAAIGRERPLPDDTGLLLHTSGTTGAPKLVPLTHRLQVTAFAHRAALIRLSSADRCLCVAPMFAASGIRRNLGPSLAVGASVVCAPGFVADAFFDWVDEFKPTYYSGPPAMHRAVVDAFERRGRPEIRSLRFILIGSAVLPPSFHEKLEQTLGVRGVQSYASTEGGCIAHDPLPPGRRKIGATGLPAGCEVRILGESGEFLPAGRTGEIVARGGEVFDGYENDAAANTLAFHEGWYRTGDLGHLDDEGYVYVTGRIKELINRGGVKVAPAAVDAALLQHPDVAEAATFGVPHPTLGEDVVAAVVARAAGSPSEQQLRDFALQRLAGYMVPSRIVFAAEIPKNALGKVLRGVLAQTFASERRAESIPPRDPHEQFVAALFAEVLQGGARVGAADNFFDLGGDSLRGAQVVNRANAAFGLNLPIESLFRRPTVAEFAAELRAAAESGNAFALPPIKPRSRRETPMPSGQGS